jgi:phosphatidylcholine synthase
MLKNKKDIDTLLAWSVHLLTCSGLIAGFLALICVFKNDETSAFLFLGLALLIDAVDGTLARKFKVSIFVKNIDGKMLDSVIDFFNYIIIPSVMIYWFKFVPSPFEIIIPSIILIVSAISYSNNNLMTSDNFYKGFPCIWNILLFYLYLFDLSQVYDLFLISACILLKFIPMKFIHPLRVNKYRRYSAVFMVLWFITSFKILLTSFYDLNNNFDYLFLGIWLISNTYFICLTFYELYRQVFKNIFLKIKRQNS